MFLSRSDTNIYIYIYTPENTVTTTEDKASHTAILTSGQSDLAKASSNPPLLNVEGRDLRQSV